MGLDVTAYQNVRKIAAWPDPEQQIDDIAEYDPDRGGYVWNGQRVTYIHPLSIGPYHAHVAPLTPGIYIYDAECECWGSSYSSYNAWRDWLSRTALGMSARAVWARWGDDSVLRARGAAWLVNFSDCEGYLSGPVSTRILADLRQHEATLRESGNQWEIEGLDAWLRGLGLAAENGLIEFH